MRLANVLFGVVAVTAFAGCGASPEGQEEPTLQVESTLEATGQVQFFVEARGRTQGLISKESTRRGHENDFAAFRFHMALMTPLDPTSGAPTGKPQVDLVTVTKEFGASDPLFLQAAAKGEELTTVTLKFVKSSATGASSNFQTVTLTNARIQKIERATIQLDDAAKTSMYADEISFRFQKLTVTHVDGGRTFTYDSQSGAQ